MKKSFLVKKSFVIGLLLTCLTTPILPKEADSDFDKFLEELFGPAPTKKEVPEKKEPERIAPTPEKAPTPDGKKVTAAEQAKLEQKAIHKLNRISKLLGELIPVAENEIFSAKVRDKIRKEIYKKVKEIQTKSRGIVEEKVVEDEFLEKAIDKKIPYQKQGFYGLEALIKEILSEDIYIVALAQKTALKKTITNFAAKLSALNKTINKFFKDIAKIKPTEQEQLTQLRLPLKQRKEPMSLLRIEKKKVFNRELKRQFKGQKRIQKLLKNLYTKKNKLQKKLQDLFVKEIPNFTKQLETLINDPEVKKQKEKEIKTAAELARQAERESKSRYSSGYRGGRDGYDRPRRWGRDGDWEPFYPRDGYRDDFGPGRRYEETREGEKEAEESEKEEPTKPADDTSQKPARDKKKDDKEPKLKTDLISLMNKAATLIKEICSTIKATTTIVDEIVGTTLANNHYKIQELNDIVTQIEKNKNTKQAKEDKKQKEAEWKSAERDYHQAFDNHMKPLVMLAKYGNVKIVKKLDGRYAIDISTQTQNALRNTYRFLRSTATKKTTDKEPAIKQEITDIIKTTIITNVNSLELFNHNLHLLALGSDNTIETTKEHLLAILRMILAANNTPLPIATTTTNLGIQQTQLDRIKQLEIRALGKFSSFLQKHIFEVQKHEAAAETHFKQLIKKLDVVIKSQNIPDTSPQKLLKTFAYQGTRPARGAAELNTLFGTRASIGGKNYTYLQVARYHFTAAALNELDKCILLIDQIRKRTNWNLKQPAPPAIKIIEALSASDFEPIRTGEKVKTIQAAYLCDVKTETIQRFVNANLATVARIPTNLAKAKELFRQFYELPRQPRTKKLFIHCKIRTDGITEEKAFIYPAAGRPLAAALEVKPPDKK